jgi:hypothetical protein
MKTKLLVAFSFSMLIVVSFMPRAIATQGGLIVNCTVKDLTTREDVTAKDKFERGEYNITFTVNVTQHFPSTFLSLTTYLEHASSVDRYWEVHPPYPPFANLTGMDPNQTRLEINMARGLWNISSYGKIQKDITVQRCESLQIELHRTVQDYLAIELKDASGNSLDRVTFNVVDAKIAEYKRTLNYAEGNLTKMRNVQVVSKYIELYENILNEAKSESSLGFVEKAISLLNLLPSSVDGLPTQHVPSLMETLFVPAVAGLSVAVVLVGALFFRLRGKLGYTLKVLEDQVKDLEGAIMKASRVDKSISARLESIRDRIKSLIGV